MRLPILEIENAAQGAVRKQFRRLQGDVSQQILDIHSAFHFSLQEKCQTSEMRLVEKRNRIFDQIGLVDVGFDGRFYQRKQEFGPVLEMPGDDRRAVFIARRSCRARRLRQQPNDGFNL
ncbi:hypothetical protein CK231_29400 [Mesorhizobium loti]|uniref:Uncharacterized protein n=3 Tax=Mesorhizobium TaxID=68287 RepID=A0A1A5JZA6_RHILI|nr:hypothetical protein BAE39_26625 [Mesorhizobium loti]QGX80145.1 hypothetical protein EB234_27230 [Mesorhizobium japonicum R7A]RNJ44868.1 hypothetical protein DNR46_13185 [Mesorhizobium japonicum]RXT51672.1 hypothetical protein B5V01_00820 [Mesorhizobium erdmanii]OBP71327.1 hypothetical protein BAE42_19045 [Mesorhizobium loti]